MLKIFCSFDDMRKITLTIFSISVLSVALFAQEKKKTDFLPLAGEFSIGFDAVPALDYAMDKTRVFSNTAPSSAAGMFSYQTPLTLVGRYMITDDQALRGKVRLGVSSSSQFSEEAKVNGQPDEKVENTEKTNSFVLGVELGKQHYLSSRRLRGFWGYEGILNLASVDNKNYEYGNDLRVYGEDGSRSLSSSNGLNIGIGARGFVGAEYFFANRMSLSVEYGYALNYNIQTNGTIVEEQWTENTKELKEVESDNFKKARGLNLDVDNASGSITLSFYL